MEHRREDIQDGGAAEWIAVDSPRAVTPRVAVADDLRWEQPSPDESLHIIQQIGVPGAQSQPERDLRDIAAARVLAHRIAFLAGKTDLPLVVRRPPGAADRAAPEAPAVGRIHGLDAAPLTTREPIEQDAP